MSKKKKTFKEILAELSATPDERKVEFRRERRYFLIVCEGERTEPNYFRSYRDMLPPHMVDTIELEGIGENTIDVVNKAIDLKTKRLRNTSLPNYDEVWAVFDKDDFPNQRVNNAHSIASKNGVQCGFSNEAFELWYILHFDFLHAAITRDQYIERLNAIFMSKINEKYAKNREDIFEILEQIGDQSLAIRYAKTLESMFVNVSASASNPSTSVYKLVEKLNEYTS